MLIAELRGTIITIRAEALTDNYFDELQRSKKDQKKSLSEILVDQDIGVGYKDFNSAYEYKGLQLNSKGELIITGFDNDSYMKKGTVFLDRTFLTFKSWSIRTQILVGAVTIF